MKSFINLIIMRVATYIIEDTKSLESSTLLLRFSASACGQAKIDFHH